MANYVGVLVAGTRIEQHYAVRRLQKTGAEQMVVGCGRRRAFRRQQNAFLGSPVAQRGKDLLIVESHYRSIRFADDIEDQVISVGLWHAQTRGEGGGVFP